jgi:hypothetical protein
MSAHSLSQIINKPAMLKYTVVLMLLLAIGSSFLYEWHDASHALHSDKHCSLCQSLDDHDNILPFFFPSTLNLSLAGITVEPSAKRHLSLFVRTSGNRDPPQV